MTPQVGQTLIASATSGDIDNPGAAEVNGGGARDAALRHGLDAAIKVRPRCRATRLNDLGPREDARETCDATGRNRLGAAEDLGSAGLAAGRDNLAAAVQHGVDGRPGGEK